MKLHAVLLSVLLISGLFIIESCKKDPIKPVIVVPPPVLKVLGAFKQVSPAAGEKDVSLNPSFSWQAATNAKKYSLLVSSKSDFSTTAFEANDITVTNYTLSADSLKDGFIYYWKITAIDTTDIKIADNAGISFRIKATPPAPSPSISQYFISPGGEDNPDKGTLDHPFKTLAYAATRVPSGEGDTLSLSAGTFIETDPAVIPLGVNIVGAGETQTILSSSGVTLAAGIDPKAADYKLWFDGSLIQLVSDAYSGGNTKYGPLGQMLQATNGNQSVSGFTIDGNNRSLKVGVWVENRNNVTMHHVTVRNCAMRGAVFAKGNMDYYVPLPDDKWMNNTKIYNCTFLNNSVDLSDESLGNLCLAGLDGAEIYNITIQENQGYGIKFIYVGHYRNTNIHDCTITVPEFDSKWNEDASIELWNLSYNNQISNIVCNTWLSMVNHYQLTQYQPTVEHPSNLKLTNIRMIDSDGKSVQESIECALSGVELANSYFQDKAMGIAIWGGKGWGGDVANHNNTVHHNIFVNINRTPTFGFGNSAGVFVPDSANNIKIYNNVFDNLGNAVEVDKANGADIKNNIFLNSQKNDIIGGSNLTIQNNLRYNTNSAKPDWVISGSGTLGSGNIQGDPGLLKTGSRFTTYYQPSSSSSLVVDDGVFVGFSFNGSAPDIGAFESN